MLPIRSLFRSNLVHFCAQNTKICTSIRFRTYVPLTDVIWKATFLHGPLQWIVKKWKASSLL